MTTSNPYQAPIADISNNNTETYQPKIFTTKGRIGRLRYLAYLFISYLLMIPIIMIATILDSILDTDGSIMIAGAVISYIPLFVFAFIFAKRRFNDLNKSGWFALLFFVPIINMFIGLWLIFGPGSKNNNNFGAAPTPNPIGIKLMALVFPLIFFGILAAVAIPAYQDYVERAQQAESLLQNP